VTHIFLMNLHCNDRSGLLRISVLSCNICTCPDWSGSGAVAAAHYGTDMTAKKPLIKTTAIQYCLDHPAPDAADEVTDVTEVTDVGHLLDAKFTGAPQKGADCLLAIRKLLPRAQAVHKLYSCNMQAAADADEEAPVADVAEAVADDAE
jgi:hypothetical protein